MEKRKKIETIQGILLSLLLISTGSQNWESYPVISWMNIIFGFGLLIYSILFIRKGRNSLFKIVMITLEGIALLLTAYIYFSKGKEYLPYAILLAAVLCFIGAVIIFRKRQKK